MEKNKLLVRQYYAEVVNTGDVDRVPEFVASDYVEIYNGTRNECGIGGATAHILGVRSTFTDLHLAVEQQIAEHGGAANMLESLLHIGAVKVVGPAD